MGNRPTDRSAAKLADRQTRLRLTGKSAGWKTGLRLTMTKWLAGWLAEHVTSCVNVSLFINEVFQIYRRYPKGNNMEFAVIFKTFKSF